MPASRVGTVLAVSAWGETSRSRGADSCGRDAIFLRCPSALRNSCGGRDDSITKVSLPSKN
jgi:hypothetical protein